MGINHFKMLFLRKDAQAPNAGALIEGDTLGMSLTAVVPVMQKCQEGCLLLHSRPPVCGFRIQGPRDHSHYITYYPIKG